MQADSLPAPWRVLAAHVGKRQGLGLPTKWSKIVQSPHLWLGKMLVNCANFVVVRFGK